MSSWLNAQPPPAPPPRSTAASAVGASDAPPPPPPATGEPPRQPFRKGHSHTATVDWNDAPDLSSLAGSSGPSRSRSKRERVTSRPPAPAALSGGTPAYTAPLSSAPALPPPSAGMDAKVLAPDSVLPAFNAPPPPPPEPQWSIRYGPRGLPSDVVYWAPMIEPERVQPAVGQGKEEEEHGRVTLVFVPGNPGLVSYYPSFLSSLRAALPSPLRENTEIYAIGHLGHSTSPRPGGGGFAPKEQASLEEQVEDKVRFLEELKREGKRRVVMLGHSIGGWVGLQIINQRPDLLHSLLLLFPTLSHMSSTPNGRSLSPLFSSWLLRPVFYSSSALSYLPTSLLSRLVGLITGHSGPGARTTSELVSSPQTVLAALTMAREELATVRELDAQAVKRGAGRLWVYYAEEGRDGWVTAEGMREVEQAVQEALGEEERKRRVRRCEEGMPHAFVLDEAHTASLARKCATWIVEDLAALDAGGQGTKKDTA